MPGLGTKSGTAFRRDILANRPVAEASIEGFFFFATDDNGGTFYQCDGITWLPVTNGLRNIVAGTGITIVNSPGTVTVSSALPVATSSTLGAVKIGSNIFIDAGAHISVPIASPSILGVIRVGDGLVIDGDGILSVIDLPVEHNGTLVADRHILNLIDGTNVTLNIVDDAINDRVSVTVNASGGGGGGEGVEHGGTLIGTRPNINFIDGSNVSLTVTDNPGSSRVDVTVASSGGGGSSLTDYQTAVMADSPLAFWPLTEQGLETTDTYADITGNGYDLHLYFGKAFHDDPDNHLGYVYHIEGITYGTTAPYFDGYYPVDPFARFFGPASDALWTNNTLGLPTSGQPYTLEGWLLPDAQNAYNNNQWIAYGPINHAGPFVGSDVKYEFGYPSDNDEPYTYIETNGPTYTGGRISQNIRPHYIADEEWHHVVLTDTGAGTVKLYYDGLLIKTSTGVGTTGLVYNGANRLFIGDPGTGDFSTYPAPAQSLYTGAISHPAIYNTVLTDAQIANHYDVANNTGATKMPMCVASTGASNDPFQIPILNNSAFGGLVPLRATHIDKGTQRPMHDLHTGAHPERVYIHEDGLYALTAFVAFTPVVNSGVMSAYITLNGTPTFNSQDFPLLPWYTEPNWVPGNFYYFTFSGFSWLYAGAWLSLNILQTSGMTQNLDSISGDGRTNSWLMVAKMSGPSYLKNKISPYYDQLP